MAMNEIDSEAKRLSRLRDRLWNNLSELPGLHLNGHSTQRLPNNLNISNEGISGSVLLSELRGAIALSSGSACSSSKAAPFPRTQSLRQTR